MLYKKELNLTTLIVVLDVGYLWIIGLKGYYSKKERLEG